MAEPITLAIDDRTDQWEPHYVLCLDGLCWKCKGREADTERCYHCGGRGFITTAAGDALLAFFDRHRG